MEQIRFTRQANADILADTPEAADPVALEHLELLAGLPCELQDRLKKDAVAASRLLKDVGGMDPIRSVIMIGMAFVGRRHQQLHDGGKL
jgi:hypothetical protein